MKSQGNFILHSSVTSNKDANTIAANLGKLGYKTKIRSWSGYASLSALQSRSGKQKNKVYEVWVEDKFWDDNYDTIESTSEHGGKRVTRTLKKDSSLLDINLLNSSTETIPVRTVIREHPIRLIVKHIKHITKPHFRKSRKNNGDGGIIQPRG